MPKYLLILSLLLPLATGCEREADDDTAGQQPVVFTAHTGGEDATRAGVIDDSNLSSIGVFACYTGQSSWSESTSKSNFMYNQPVNKTGDIWTYTPVKYWPNTEGDKLSFFAYAPHAEKVGSQLRTYGYNSSDATGYPSFRYEPPVDATKQTDLLFATPLMNRTKGSELSFTMGHVLTHVLFKVKSTSAISVTKVQVNSGTHYGDIKFNTSGYSWTSLTGNQSFYKTATVAVPANTLTDLGEFFLLPSNAKSVSLTFSEGGIEQPVTTVALPASPVWEMNKTVAYTLNIENKTKVTLSVKKWDTGSVSANLGEEVSGTYPFMKNGILYESATKYYCVSPVGGWVTWEPAVRKCRGNYSFINYGLGEWRLPDINELGNIVKLFGLGSSYWSITEDNLDNSKAQVYSGGKKTSTLKTIEGGLLLCVRDLGNEIYPTVRRTDDGFRVLYRNATQCIMVQKDISSFSSQAVAKTYCSSLSEGGYGGWRLPTRDEATDMANAGIYNGSSYWIDASSNAVIQGSYEKIDFVNSALDGNNGRARCVRNY